MNTAFEIASVLERFASHAGNTPLSTCWAAELQCAEGSADYFLGLATIQSKMEILRSHVETSSIGDRSKGLYLSAINSLMRCVRANQVHSINGKELNQLTTNLQILFIASEQLPNHLVPEVNPLTVSELVQQLEALTSATEAADIDPELRQIVASLLATLLMVVRSHALLGPSGSAKIFGSVAAELHRVWGLPAAQAPAARSLLKDARKLCLMIGGAIVFAGSVVSGAHSILTDGSDILGLSGEASAEAPAEPSEHPTGHHAASELPGSSDTPRSAGG
jgi:hypothetical protein